jgi:phosphoglycerate dehydrogenase-like enzyme
MKNGKWRREDAYTEGLLDQTIGLVGFGMVAKEVVKMLRPFRVKIKVYSKDINEQMLKEYSCTECTTLEEIVSTCKIVSIHVPQRPDTYHMINENLLSMLREGSLLVNTARGSVIDEKALVKELRKNRFKAVLDVYETEPLQEDSELRELENVILIPHMAGPTTDRRKFVTLGLIEDISRFFNGQPLKYEIDSTYAAMMTQ